MRHNYAFVRHNNGSFLRHESILGTAQELAGECGSQALNPNELGAVLKVLSLLAAELEVDAAGELSTVRIGGDTLG